MPPVIVKITCNKCGATGTICLQMNITSLNVEQDIKLSLPCPICGGELGSPVGRYEKNEEDVLVRIADFDSNQQRRYPARRVGRSGAPPTSGSRGLAV
jgi:hypothetical protein